MISSLFLLVSLSSAVCGVLLLLLLSLILCVVICTSGCLILLFAFIVGGGGDGVVVFVDFSNLVDCCALERGGTFCCVYDA